MDSLLRHLDELIFLLIFVGLPILQRVFQALGKKRGEALARGRERRRAEGPQEASRPGRGRPTSAESEGTDLWRELLRGMAEGEAEAEERPVERAPAPRVARPAPSPATPAEPALAGSFQKLEAGLAAAPTEDELERPGSLRREPLATLVDFDVHAADEALVELRGLGSDDHKPSQAPPRPTRRRADARRSWGRAIVLSEVLRPPLALRGPVGLVPGDPQP
jgi:hypothetical protein